MPPVPRWLRPAPLAAVVLRLRTPVMLGAGAALLIASFTGPGWLMWAAAAVFAGGLILVILPGAVPAASRRDAVGVLPPVEGRWIAVNSPASRVPSHGTHAYGQSYAIDLVYAPDAGRPRSGPGVWPLIRPPRAFPGFGQPVLAPADGVVARVSDWQRDHLSRDSWPAGLWTLVIEGAVREILGPGRVIGNHVVLDLGDGVYALLAHLRRRSVLVTRGQRVQAGQPLAGCGNSGNSTEPHLHFQLMDRAGVLLAAGLPFRFDGQPTGCASRRVAGRLAGVPPTGQALAAGSQPG